MRGAHLQTDWFKINKAAFFLTLLLCFCLFTNLFYKMATCVYENDWSPYYSDIIFHIDTAITTGTYSLMGTIMKILYVLPYDTASLLLAMVIAAMEILTVYSVYLLLLELDRVTGKETRRIDGAIYQWFALISIFIVSFYIPGILPSYYFNALNMTCWHNDTYIAMRPFSILTIWIFIRIYSKFDEGLDKKELIVFGALLFISTWMKPNFFIAFAILLLILALWCLVKKKDKLTVFKRLVVMAFCTIPSVVCLLIQNTLLFSDDVGGNSVVFDPFLVVGLRVTAWPLALVVLLAFPLMVLLVELKARNKNSFSFIMIWLLWAILNCFGFFFAESGPRLYDFNFVWGMTFANGILYIGTYYMWYCRLRSNLCYKQPFIECTPGLPKNVATAYYAIGLTVLIYLLIVGVYYFMLIYTGSASFAKL